MTLRPLPARWFEILVSRDDLLKAVDVLAKSGKVELEIHSDVTERMVLPDLRDRFEEYNLLLRRYQNYWPMQNTQPSDLPGNHVERLDLAIQNLRDWQLVADPVITQLEEYETELADLQLLVHLLGHMHGNVIDLKYIAQAGPVISARVFVLPVTAQLAHVPPKLLSMRVPVEQRTFLIVVGTRQDVDNLQQELIAGKGHMINIPTWLSGNPEQARQEINRRVKKIEGETALLNKHLEKIASEKHLAEALGDVQQIEWFITHVTELPITENFAWVTGWTSATDGDYLNHILGQQHIRAVVHYPHAPIEISPPMVMSNPWFIQPFELFAKMLGVPAHTEMDPSVLLAIIVPVLFGYMFGDVGHGAILLLAGLLLQAHWQILRILISCGISSIGFGVLFGSVFGYENLIAARWVSPVHEPLVVLFTPLLGGVFILLIGLILNGIQSYWRNELRRWFLNEAAMLVIYIGVIASLLTILSLALTVFGIIWYLVGNVFISNGKVIRTMMISLGQLLESIFQLLINTISFVRVGAFALAHSGLSLAVIVMAGSTDSMVLKLSILVLGNLIILVLEGLVVSIQTTRLILFEFFIRFLRGTGRMFQPLASRERHIDDNKR